MAERVRVCLSSTLIASSQGSHINQRHRSRCLWSYPGCICVIKYKFVWLVLVWWRPLDSICDNGNWRFILFYDGTSQITAYGYKSPNTTLLITLQINHDKRGPGGREDKGKSAFPPHWLCWGWGNEFDSTRGRMVVPWVFYVSFLCCKKFPVAILWCNL